MVAFISACLTVLLAQGEPNSSAYNLGRALGSGLVYVLIALLIWKLFDNRDKKKGKKGTSQRRVDDGGEAEAPPSPRER